MNLRKSGLEASFSPNREKSQNFLPKGLHWFRYWLYYKCCRKTNPNLERTMARINAQFGNSGKRYSIEVHNGDGVGDRSLNSEPGESDAIPRT